MAGDSLIRIGHQFGSCEEKYIVRGEGAYLYDNNGRKYLDLCGGIWNIPFGYGNSYITDKIKKQLDILPFCNLITNETQEQSAYAKRLAAILEMENILFTCSGSEAVEASVKAARQYQRIRGNERSGIAAFNLSYHGTSYGAMSVSGIDKDITKVFGPLLSEISWIETPHEIYDTKKWNNAIKRVFDEKAHMLAAVIIEPIIASGGVVSIPDETLYLIEKLCRQNDILMIYDEVTTGFGRTGAPFMYLKKNIKPDLVCLSKGITNGYMPFGTVAFSKKVAETFGKSGSAFEHFSSQSGNLLSVAAGNAVLDLMEDYDSFEVAKKGELFRNALSEGLPEIKGTDVRGSGLIVGISFNKELSDRTLESVISGLERQGILTYYFNNPGYNKGLSFFPPFTIDEETLLKAAGIICKRIKREPEIRAFEAACI